MAAGDAAQAIALGPPERSDGRVPVQRPGQRMVWPGKMGRGSAPPERDSLQGVFHSFYHFSDLN